MRDDYLQNALSVINDPMILINVVSRRVKQLRRGNRALVVSLEKLSLEDTALREIADGKITFDLATAEELASHGGGPAPRAVHNSVFASPETAVVAASGGATGVHS